MCFSCVGMAVLKSVLQMCRRAVLKRVFRLCRNGSGEEYVPIV